MLFRGGLQAVYPGEILSATHDELALLAGHFISQCAATLACPGAEGTQPPRPSSLIHLRDIVLAQKFESPQTTESEKAKMRVTLEERYKLVCGRESLPSELEQACQCVKRCVLEWVGEAKAYHPRLLDILNVLIEQNPERAQAIQDQWGAFHSLKGKRILRIEHRSKKAMLLTMYEFGEPLVREAVAYIAQQAQAIQSGP
jgi:hypothetical protein